MKNLILVLLFLGSSSIFAADDLKLYQSPKDLAAEMLELISGPVDEPRDWVAFRNLFLPTVQFVNINPKAPAGRQTRTWNLEQFIRNIGPLYARDGFLETPLGYRIDEFNGIAQVFQSYEAKNLLGTYSERGVNSFQMVFADGRWWIASCMFSNETEEISIPAEYIKAETE